MPRVTPVMERLMRRVVIDDNDCWIWTGATTNGYGIIGLGPRGAGTRNTHRVTYTDRHGEVPAGYVLDHLCRVPACCNPDHLEPVSQAVNVERGKKHLGSHAETCRGGHPMEEHNLIIIAGREICAACNDIRNARKRERHHARKAARAAIRETTAHTMKEAA